MKIITICNQKGGVGKTTTATTISSGLNKSGFKTLLIDIDPQRNSTSIYKAKSDNVRTIYDAMNKSCSLQEVVQKNEYGDIVPSDPLLSEAEHKYINQGREYLLQEAINTLEEDYDFIIIDTPPTRGVLLVNATTASDYLIIPVVPDGYSIEGLFDLKVAIEATIKYSNPHLEVLGIIITSDQAQTVLSKEFKVILQDLAKAFNSKVFNESIPQSIKVKESITERVPLPYYAPYSPPMLAYNGVIKEIIDISK